MRVLIIKTSSMGDIIHTLPALQDAVAAHPGITFHWLIEKSFSEIPYWSPAVKQVIPIELRRWRCTLNSVETRRAIKALWSNLRKYDYDLIIDAQGLLKSAVLAKLAKGPATGYSWRSARESIASLFYRKKITCHYQQHAIDRNRILFSQALNYTMPNLSEIDYGLLSRYRSREDVKAKPYIIFFHAASVKKKLWLPENWIQLGHLLQATGYTILLPWGNQSEQLRAQHISKYLDADQVKVLPKLTLNELKGYIFYAEACVSVDTGLAHLSAALNKTNCVLYAETNPNLIGTRGLNQHHYHMKSTTPKQIYEQILLEHIYQE